MRLRETLLSAAAVLVASGCGGNNKSEPNKACPADPRVVWVDAAVACAIAEQTSGACSQTCQSEACPIGCDLPPDWGMVPADAAVVETESGCPAVAGPIPVSCHPYAPIGGRRTEGFATRTGAASDGERLANMAWLEAVSVHAFERLERELAAHGAPPALSRDARRARRDEVRHTAMTTRLARRRGVTPATPERSATMHVRALVDVAIENAVEGCVRETYGALIAFVEALSSPDPSLRRAMRSIAEDECRHAELAWSVHAWALPRLRPAERQRVEHALGAAAREVPAWRLLTELRQAQNR